MANWKIVAVTFGLGMLMAASGNGEGTADKPLFTVSTKTTVVTEPLRADSTVDYVAAINDRCSQDVTPENNGFVTWLRLIGTSTIPASTRDQTLVMCGAENIDAETGWKIYPGDAAFDSGKPLRLWKAGDDPALAAFLKDQDKLLSIATDAAAKPHWWCPNVSTDGTLMMVLLPDLNSLRAVSWALCTRALLRAQQGDFDGFLADVMTAKRLSRHAVGWTMVSHLVAQGTDDLANQAIGVAVGAGLFSSTQCAKLAKMLDELEPLGPMWQGVDVGERWGQLDLVASIANGKLNPAIGEGKAMVRRAVDRNSVEWDVLLMRVNTLMDEAVAAMKISSAEQADAARKAYDLKLKPALASLRNPGSQARKQGETRKDYTDRVSNVILAQYMPAMWRSDDKFRATIIRDRLARVVVAAGQYKADKGTWPQKPQDLVPQYLHEAVIDPYSPEGQQWVRCVTTSAGVKVYSIGPNRVDDGGVSNGPTKKDDIAVGAAGN